MLRKNIDSLGVAARVIAKPAEQAVTELARERFDLVFCDPPWAKLTTLFPVIATLGGLLHTDDTGEGAQGLLVLEHDKRAIIPESLDSKVHVVERRVYGDTALAFFETSVYSPDSGELGET
jgi:16S rRNA G966 N2-methylase RsmD